LQLFYQDIKRFQAINTVGWKYIFFFLSDGLVKFAAGKIWKDSLVANVKDR
jgi:hypothetical protein